MILVIEKYVYNDCDLPPLTYTINMNQIISADMMNIESHSVIIFITNDGFVNSIDSDNLKFENCFRPQLNIENLDQMNFDKIEAIHNFRPLMLKCLNKNRLVICFEYGFSMIYDMKRIQKIGVFNPYYFIFNFQNAIFEKNIIPDVWKCFHFESDNKLIMIHKKEGEDIEQKSYVLDEVLIIIYDSDNKNKFMKLTGCKSYLNDAFLFDENKILCVLTKENELNFEE